MNLSHIDENGKARMVDVSGKEITTREAVATGRVYMKQDTLKMIAEGSLPKGDVFSTAKIAGIMAAKHTWEMIPMCHQIPLDAIHLELSGNPQKSSVDIKAAIGCCWKTGVEMEALTAVSVAALTVYDMCKAVDKEMVIGEITLIRKTGGKSGTYISKENKESV
jgi:cyclic pyranopterin phosphate synthase